MINNNNNISKRQYLFKYTNKIYDKYSKKCVSGLKIPKNMLSELIEKDDDGNCLYCGQKCWEGISQMCDEQQAGGF